MESNAFRSEVKYDGEDSVLDDENEVLGVLPPKKTLDGRNFIQRQLYFLWYFVQIYTTKLHTNSWETNGWFDDV